MVTQMRSMRGRCPRVSKNPTLLRGALHTCGSTGVDVVAGLRQQPEIIARSDRAVASGIIERSGKSESTSVVKWLSADTLAWQLLSTFLQEPWGQAAEWLTRSGAAEDRPSRSPGRPRVGVAGAAEEAPSVQPAPSVQESAGTRPTGPPRPPEGDSHSRTQPQGDGGLVHRLG